MGIESRDYYRDSSYTDRIAGWSLDFLPPVCKWLLILNVAVFLLQIFVSRVVETLAAGGRSPV